MPHFQLCKVSFWGGGGRSRNETRIIEVILLEERDERNLSNKLKFVRICNNARVNENVAGTKCKGNSVGTQSTDPTITCFTYDFQSLTHSKNTSINLPTLTLFHTLSLSHSRSLTCHQLRDSNHPNGIWLYLVGSGSGCVCVCVDNILLSNGNSKNYRRRMKLFT